MILLFPLDMCCGHDCIDDEKRALVCKKSLHMHLKSMKRVEIYSYIPIQEISDLQLKLARSTCEKELVAGFRKVRLRGHYPFGLLAPTVGWKMN